MANQVFANGMEISCKAADGKSIAAFPDVCFTPPTAPPTPPGVPIPYPNTGMASDCTDGSKTVSISGKEVMLKNKSYFKKSTGNEAGSAPKKGMITSVNRGKVYFNSWSMDVKVEGENVVRHLDLTTHNHASMPGATPPWPFMASMNIDSAGNTDDPCAEDKKREQDACGGKSRSEQCSDSSCVVAQACKLVPKNKDKEMCCKGNDTGHHLIEDHWIRPGGDLMPGFKRLEKKVGSKFKKPGGPYGGAPTMCANRSRYSGKHGIAHGTGGVLEETFIGKSFNYGHGKAIALQAHADANPWSKCNEDCIAAQLDDFYGEDPRKKLHSPTKKQPMTRRQRAAAERRVGGGDL